MGTSYNAAMQQQREKYGGLPCRVIDRLDGKAPDSLVILMHGFGAPGDDLVPIAGELLGQAPFLASGTRFIFPEAPLDLSMIGMFGARAWWMIDQERLFSAIASQEILDPATREEPPEGVIAVRESIQKLLVEVADDTGVPLTRTVIGGFSQGSMLACDVALRLEQSPAGVILWSSMPICVKEWRENAPRHRGMPVFQSHGRQDPLLPYPLAEELRDMLCEAGIEVEYVPFDGPHTIGLEAYAKVIPWLERALAEEGRDP